ncbi:hypothetical protein [Microbacterium sp. MTN4-26]|uniref:hypothetical protein n=1 Tax=unclassified Microbacterium TaxID=2609290 RepID=UPI0036F1DECE
MADDDDRERPRRPRYTSNDRNTPARGDRKPYQNRDGDRSYGKRDDRKPYQKRDGDRSYGNRDDRKPYQKREGDRSYGKRDDRKPYQRRDGDRSYGKREDRGPRRDAEPREPRAPRRDVPEIPEEITARSLPNAARNDLKTLSKENADAVARHLAMAGLLIDDDPALAHRHALEASHRAGRIAVVRETVAITAYAVGDYALALRELRTYRRISGKDDQIALQVDSERGVGRADRALEVGRSVDRDKLPTAARVELAIAMSGARLDVGETERALLELDIPELDPDRAFEWSPALFAARAAVLEELGRAEEAEEWYRRATIAAEALDDASGFEAGETVWVDEVEEEEDAEASDRAQPAGDASVEPATGDDPQV